MADEIERYMIQHNIDHRQDRAMQRLLNLCSQLPLGRELKELEAQREALWRSKVEERISDPEVRKLFLERIDPSARRQLSMWKDNKDVRSISARQEKVVQEIRRNFRSKL